MQTRRGQGGQWRRHASWIDPLPFEVGELDVPLDLCREEGLVDLRLPPHKPRRTIRLPSSRMPRTSALPVLRWRRRRA